jgi:hypothetical protein
MAFESVGRLPKQRGCGELARGTQRGSRTVVCVGGLVLALCVAGACKKKEGEGGKAPIAPSVAPAIPPPPPVPPSQPTAGLAADGGATAAIADPQKAGDWIARTVTPALEAEAKNRPAGALRAEDVLSAIEKQGIKLLGRNQSLGSIIGASYCLSADTEKLTGVLVCEYIDGAAASKGQTLAKQIFGLALPIQVFVKGKTILSVTHAAESADAAAEAKKIGDVFGTL